MDTSANARRIASQSAEFVREQIYDYIATRPEGATCDETEQALSLRHSTCSARIRELHQAGRLAYNPKQTRLTSADCPARVYHALQQAQVTVTVTMTTPARVRANRSVSELQESIRRALQEI